MTLYIILFFSSIVYYCTLCLTTTRQAPIGGDTSLATSSNLVCGFSLVFLHVSLMKILVWLTRLSATVMWTATSSASPPIRRCTTDLACRTGSPTLTKPCATSAPFSPSSRIRGTASSDPKPISWNISLYSGTISLPSYRSPPPPFGPLTPTYAPCVTRFAPPSPGRLLPLLQ